MSLVIIENNFLSSWSQTSTGLLHLPLSSLEVREDLLALAVLAPVDQRTWVHLSHHLDQCTRQESCPVMSKTLSMATLSWRPRSKATSRHILCKCLLDRASPANLGQCLTSADSGALIPTTPSCYWPASCLMAQSLTPWAAMSRGMTTGKTFIIRGTTIPTPPVLHRRPSTSLVTFQRPRALRIPGGLWRVLWWQVTDRVAHRLVYLLLPMAASGNQLAAKQVATTGARYVTKMGTTDSSLAVTYTNVLFPLSGWTLNGGSQWH